MTWTPAPWARFAAEARRAPVRLHPLPRGSQARDSSRGGTWIRSPSVPTRSADRDVPWRPWASSRSNPAFCRMMGYPPEESVWLRVRDITHPDDPRAEPGPARPARRPRGPLRDPQAEHPPGRLPGGVGQRGRGAGRGAPAPSHRRPVPGPAPARHGARLARDRAGAPRPRAPGAPGQPHGLAQPARAVERELRGVGSGDAVPPSSSATWTTSRP